MIRATLSRFFSVPFVLGLGGLLGAASLPSEPQPSELQESKGQPTDSALPTDWAELQAVHRARAHVVRPDRDGFVARSPQQRWTTRFDGRGFTTKPEGSDWSWGLELERYGFEGAEEIPADTACSSAIDTQVVYSWGPDLEEWFVNDANGIEHGYTLHTRPLRAVETEGTSERLIFTLSPRGTLSPRITPDARGVDFIDSDGVVALTYSGLFVFDADGTDLDASFQRAGDKLQILIDEREARYPLTIDPVAQQAYIKASNTNTLDLFGASVAISGDTAVIGALGEDSNATGVDGNQADNSARESGAAYVFVRNGTTWSQQAYLKASNTDASDFFGESVDVDGDTIVVGARLEDSNATTINGDDSDNSAQDAGAAYVFVRSGTTWSQEAYLKASNAEAMDQFARSVAISGNTIVVGARLEDSNATGANGNEADNSTADSGAAYVFVRSGTTWSQEAYLKASNPDPSDVFGIWVDVSGDTIVVGAPDEDSLSAGVNGPEGDNSGVEVGAAYVFFRTGTSWSQQAYLKASNPDTIDLFGRCVSVSGDTIAVGALAESSSAKGVGGNESDNSAMGAGAAYVFTRSGSTWSQEAYVKAFNTEAGDNFGVAVAVSGDSLVVGARNEASSAVGTEGSQSDNSAPQAGAVYLFLRNGTTWTRRSYIKASNTDAGDYFGASVAVDADTILVGAVYEHGGDVGVNGAESNNSAVASGAAYALGPHPPVVATETSRVGTPPNPNVFLPGVTSRPIIGTTWDPVVDHTSFAVGASVDFLAISLLPAVNITTGLGTLLCDPSVLGLMLTGPPGVPFAVPVPDVCMLVGKPACTQAGSFTPGLGVELTNALDLVFGTQ